MITPSHVKVDESQRYAFIEGVIGKPITYVRLQDVYDALSRARVNYSSLMTDEIDAKIELLNELKTKGW